jgi:uncharacterized protein
MNAKNLSMSILAGILISHSFGMTNAAYAAEAQKTEDIKTLLHITKADAMGKQVGDTLLANFRSAAPNVPESFWQEAQTELDAFDNVKLLVSIYDKNFSHEDIKALIAFYKTPTGRRFIEAQPVMMNEAMTAGQKWGEQAAKKIIEKLKAKGYS